MREGTLTFGHLGDMETNDILDCFIFSLCFQLFVRNDVLKVFLFKGSPLTYADSAHFLNLAQLAS